MSTLVINGDQHDILYVLAIMLFPENEQLRTQFTCTHLVSTDMADEKTLSLYGVSKNDTEKILLNSPTLSDFNNKIQPKIMKKTILVGSMLAELYLTNMHDLDSPSKSKARHVAINLIKKITNKDGYHLSISERTVDKYWNEYKSVAHLWAAFFLNNEYKYHNDDNIFIPDVFPTFLEIAASLQDFGTSFISDQLISNESILNLNSLWSLPEDMVRRKLSTDSNLLHIREALKTYKHSSRKKSKK